MITRSDLLSINDKYRAWLVNDELLPPERDLSVQLTTKSELYTPSHKQENTLKINKHEKTLDPNQAVDSYKQEDTLDPNIEL